jgi:hypothetical protein
MNVKLIDRGTETATLNIDAHPATFHKAWKEICANWLTCSAAKYVNKPRRAFGIYIIDGCADAIRHIFSVGFGGNR